MGMKMLFKRRPPQTGGVMYKKWDHQSSMNEKSSGKAGTLKIQMEKGQLPFWHALFGRSIQLTRNHHDAQDLIQETYSRAYRYRDYFRNGTNLRAWLYRILHNTFINIYHRRKGDKSAVHLQNFEDMASYLHNSQQIEDNSTGGKAGDEVNDILLSMDEDVQKSLGKLPEKYRIVLLLSDIFDFSYKEISRFMEIPLGTIMSRIYRARKMLEKDLMAYACARGYFRSHNPRRIRDHELMESFQ